MKLANFKKYVVSRRDYNAIKTMFYGGVFGRKDKNGDFYVCLSGSQEKQVRAMDIKLIDNEQG